MITRAHAKLIRKLGARKHRDRQEAFLIEGVRLVEELLAAAGEDIELIVTAPSLSATPRGRRLLRKIEAGAWPRGEASDAELEELADTESPQGVLAVARKPRRRLSELSPLADVALLVFDRVADPGNLGTLLRTAEALGVAWAVALPGTVDPWSPKAVRASAGSVFRLPVSREPWADVVSWLRERDIPILCADPDGEDVPRSGARLARFALVLGSEPAGLSEDVVGACDRRVAARTAGEVDSLNVAVAGALLLDRLLAGPEAR